MHTYNVHANGNEKHEQFCDSKFFDKTREEKTVFSFDFQPVYNFIST